VPTNTETPTSFVTEIATQFTTETPTSFVTATGTSTETPTGTQDFSTPTPLSQLPTATATPVMEGYPEIESRAQLQSVLSCPTVNYFVVDGSFQQLKSAIDCARQSSWATYDIYIRGTIYFETALSLTTTGKVLNFYGEGIGIGSNATILDGSTNGKIGMFRINSGTANFYNLVIRGGRINTGGAVFGIDAISGNSPTIRVESSILEDNRAEFHVNNLLTIGGIVRLSGGQIFLSNNIIRNNYADYGGIIYAHTFSFTYSTINTNCNLFTNNESKFHSNIFFFQDLKLLPPNSSQPVSITNNSFISNSLTGGDGSPRSIYYFRPANSPVILQAQGNYWNGVTNRNFIVPSVIGDNLTSSLQNVVVDPISATDPTRNFLTNPYSAPQGSSCVMTPPPPFPAPLPTPTPTIICPASLQGQAQPANAPGGGGDVCQVITPTPTLECNTNTEAQILLEHNIQVTDRSNWSSADLVALCKAVTKTAQALYNLVTEDGGRTYTNSAETFKVIMSPNGIEFRQDLDSFNCVTTANTTSALIQCGTSVGNQGNISEYVFAHELGHVFVARTAVTISGRSHPCGISFDTCMEFPLSSDGPLGIGTMFIFGRTKWRYTRPIYSRFFERLGVTKDLSNYTFSGDNGQNCSFESPQALPSRLSCISEEDWSRGYLGWGSGIEWINGVPSVGPCGESASANFLPSDFQQNPCVFIDWLQFDPDGAIKTLEINEASADMFLNWVYRQSVLLTPIVYGDEGFENAAWDDGIFERQCGAPCSSDIISGEYPESRGPGDDRYYWMRTTLLKIANYYGW
jgi:hypothetical protein